MLLRPPGWWRHIGPASGGLGGDLLATGRHVVHDLGTLGGRFLVDVLGPGGGGIAPLLGVARELAGFVSHHGARLGARTGRGQQSCNGANDATDEEHSEFVGHNCLLYRQSIRFAHYRRRAPRGGSRCSLLTLR